MANRKTQPANFLRQDLMVLSLLSKGDETGAKKILSDLAPDYKQSFLARVICGEVQAPPSAVPWLIEQTGPKADSGFMMASAVTMKKFDLLPLLHAAGFVILRTELISNAMVSAMAEGKWPHPELVWPDVIDACQGDQAWQGLFRFRGIAENTEENPKDGLLVSHLRRIEMLPHITRPPATLTAALVTLGWEGANAGPRLFPLERQRQALGWMHSNGWIDEKTVYMLGSSNTQWKAYMGEVLDFIRAQGEAYDLGDKTPKSSPTGNRARL